MTVYAADVDFPMEFIESAASVGSSDIVIGVVGISVGAIVGESVDGK